MNPVQVALVDAFTKVAGEGNRAGVVIDGAGLSESSMLAAARAVAASETAFILPGGDGANLRLRYFTPSTEVPFCGHATLATIHYLAELGRIECPGRLVFDCPAGRFEAELERHDGELRVWLTTPIHPWTESPLDNSALMALLGGDVSMLDASLPIRRGGPKLFVPLKRRQDLWNLQPRWEDLAKTGFGVFAFTREVLEKGNVAHGRFFAPAAGIREDPVTGAANGPLVAYLVLNGVLHFPEGRGTVRARAEQGDAMGKPGRVDLEVSGTAERVERARIGGVAITVLVGALRP